MNVYIRLIDIGNKTIVLDKMIENRLLDMIKRIVQPQMNRFQIERLPLHKKVCTPFDSIQFSEETVLSAFNFPKNLWRRVDNGFAGLLYFIHSRFKDERWTYFNAGDDCPMYVVFCEAFPLSAVFFPKFRFLEFVSSAPFGCAPPRPLRLSRPIAAAFPDVGGRRVVLSSSAAVEKETRKMQQVRVLIADDETLVRLDLRNTLEELGHAVVGEADNGETALQLARSLRPDVIFLDIMMPRKNGLEVAEAVGKERLGAMVMLTGYCDAPMVERATRAGVLAYLVKPYRSEEISPALLVALSRYREMNALENALAQAQELRETDHQVLQAQKVLIERFEISEQEAARRLQAQAYASNRSLREVAEAILLTADLQLAKKPRKPL